jgi:hypothetical protein
MGDAKLLPDLPQIARDSALILHNARTAYDFQVSDLRQVHEDFVLHPIGEVGILFVAAKVLKGQDSDAFVEDS